MAVKSALLAAALASVVSAQNGAYAQCGGQGFSGDSTCMSGYSCVSANSYYSQCLPGAAAPVPAPAPAPAPASSMMTTSTTVAPVVVPTSVAPLPATTVAVPPTGTAPVGAPVTITGNPFAGAQIYANPYYASEIAAYAIPSMAPAEAAKASAVAKVGTFVWLDTLSKVPTMDTYLTNIEVLNAAGASPPVMGAFVVYDLPDRDCAAAASNGEYSIANGGVKNYFAYIDAIAVILKKHPTVKVVLAVEPDSLANLVTNLNVPKCGGAESAYKQCVTYAIQTLNLPNVAMYLDAGHAGWLGWSANIAPAAQLFGKLYKAAGSPKAVRGLATNVANYNAFSGACASYTQGDSNCNEKDYVHALAPLLTAQGFPAHFIMDTSRNGVQPTSQLAWGDWCNVVGTGFGIRPTANTGDALEDAFVWIKPGGECDGTSDSSADRYDFHCGLADALKPAPQAGTWFEAYFEQLLKNANPKF